MIQTYNHPGAQSFCAVWYPNTKDGSANADKWWSNLHNRRGPCAPGGSQKLTDRVARSAKYRDGRKVYNWLPVAGPARIWINVQTGEISTQDPT
jgi:hypothetical protein